MRHAMIMAGGSGTRLWPVSREGTPKQLIGLFEGKSLLELAFERLDGVVDADNRWICAGGKYAECICESLENFPASQLLGEPEGRDTLNAVGFTATVLQKLDPDAVFAVLTADHIIQPQDVFAHCLDVGFGLVEEDPSRMVTFGITPTGPSTAYGYVELGDSIAEGAFACDRFVEKPDLETAKKYLASNQFAWNSGMFVFHGGKFLEALNRIQPETAAKLAEIGDAWGTESQQEVLDRVYPTLPKTSVDYGMMEPASTDESVSICIVPMQVTWLDVGSWPSYGETLEADACGNTGNVAQVHLDSTNMLCVSDDPNHTITTIGCDDLVIVHTKDATLVCTRSESQRVKELHSKVDPTLQ